MIQTAEIFAGDWFKSIHLWLPDTLMVLIGLLDHLCFTELPGHDTERQILNSTVNIRNLYLRLWDTKWVKPRTVDSVIHTVYFDPSLNCFCHMERGKKKEICVKLNKVWKWSAFICPLSMSGQLPCRRTLSAYQLRGYFLHSGMDGTADRHSEAYPDERWQLISVFTSLSSWDHLKSNTLLG